ncbi:DUF1244 domain-containing protein [Roseospira marina]|uniref:DUF1244 domain-containing protein n=1 Tax=Roseospira marina TaxID=140057 RepID=A0A5M6IER8_9PROT|nr:DUF1244 domain-containing protein [Roseospira marina]KAA5606770.1 DUF1244 domain-containing protein [Roseospira marina]MBB4313808.1 hypothetical protein [Roseospira marina]MBB5086970.1 hypothetical protein [Roseospira marina]
MDARTRTEIEAAAFRSLVAHLQWRTDVQNIDLMTLSGFCRNCLWKWLKAAAEKQGADLDAAEAQRWVYGMDYADWKAAHQGEATAAQKQAYAETKALHSAISKG